MKIYSKIRLKAFQFFDEDDEDFRYLSDVDKAIKKYVASEIYAVDLESILPEAIQYYPNKHSVTLYRGLNFLDKESYDKFIRTISNGRMTINKLSSWTTNKSIAESFAKSRKFNLEFAIFDKNDPYFKAKNKATKLGERLIGYKGVVLVTRILPNTGLDMTEAGYGSEAEVVLPRGTYPIKYYDYMSYEELYNGQKADDIMTKIIRKGNEQELESVFSWLQKKGVQPDDLSDYVRHYLFTQYFPNNQFKPFVKVEAEDYNPRTKQYENMYIFASISAYCDPDMFKWFTQQDFTKARVQITSALKKVVQEVKQVARNYPDYPITFKDTTQEMANALGLSSMIADTRRSFFKSRYDNINKNIYNLNKSGYSSKEKNEMINKYMEDLKDLLSYL